jgi:two-component system NtrC family sensor kinase
MEKSIKRAEPYRKLPVITSGTGNPCMTCNVINFPDRKPEQYVVLVVDDEYMMRGVLTEILKESGFYVIAVGSAEEAIRFLSKLVHFDVVFSDIKMPDMDGFELARWVHKHKPDIPVILASGYSGKTNMAADLGGAQFLQKPYDFDNIVHKLRETVSRKRTLNS